eukprot:3602824-Amphidinium_carterae.1
MSVHVEEYVVKGLCGRCGAIGASTFSLSICIHSGHKVRASAHSVDLCVRVASCMASHTLKLAGWLAGWLA